MTYLFRALILLALPIAVATPAAAQTASLKAELMKDWIELKDTTRHIAIKNAASCPKDAVTLVTLTRSQSWAARAR